MSKHYLTKFLVAIASFFAFAQAMIFLIPSKQNLVPVSSSPDAESEEKVAPVTETLQSGGNLVDGSYTGEIVTTDRGDYQVQISVEGGLLSAIDILLYPNDNPRSEEVNANALPTYTAEALDIQSSELTLISGATEAYKGFTGSLQSAIIQAQN